MTTILFAETVADIEAKINALVVSINQSTEELNYLKQARALLSSPRAASITFHLKVENESPITPTYGGLKRSVFSCLSETEPQTPQSIVEFMQARGYVFRSKTPAISVNEALQTLKIEEKARLVGKSPSGANLWVKQSGAVEPLAEESDGEESENQEPAEAGS